MFLRVLVDRLSSSLGKSSGYGGLSRQGSTPIVPPREVRRFRHPCSVAQLTSPLVRKSLSLLAILGRTPPIGYTKVPITFRSMCSLQSASFSRAERSTNAHCRLIGTQPSIGGCEIFLRAVLHSGFKHQLTSSIPILSASSRMGESLRSSIRAPTCGRMTTRRRTERQSLGGNR